MQAVKRWEYKRTVVNGEAVEVVTTISIRFSLRHLREPVTGPPAQIRV
jgi:hypothetical protein